MSSLPPPKRVGALNEMFPPKPTWTVAQVPDLAGTVALVTGGNSGIGKEMCKVLLSRNAKVYLAARSEAKAHEAIAELKAHTGKEDVHFLRLDLADLTSVRRAAEEFTANEQHLHLLFNNGGVMNTPLDNVTAQGYDGQFGTNVLGHYFLTQLLLPTLLRTAHADGQSPSKVRVIHTSSSGHAQLTVPGGIDWASVQKGDAALSARKRLGIMKLYGQSKLGNVLLSNELARRYGAQGVVSIAVHPGSIKTDLGRHMNSWSPPILIARLLSYFFYDVSYGAITPLYAGTSEEALDMNGEYLTAWARRQVPNPDALRPDLMEKLWAWCEEQVKGF
ncbi:NAD-P-binding protein [Auriscalpium vulgare]|uniref:NAD-P-binding protein n=1 Tax=Auriscalpium vulgare TaxID=40419 RepID=A0ACB8RSP2_9AGAM|nr:NAD-P-binding protein [Auriscalpium vulgare]